MLLVATQYIYLHKIFKLGKSIAIGTIFRFYATSNLIQKIQKTLKKFKKHLKNSKNI